MANARLSECPGCFQLTLARGQACPRCGYGVGRSRSPLLLPVKTQLKHYLIGEPLGQGNFGITYRAFNAKSKTLVAIKEYCPVELVTRDRNQQSLIYHSAAAQEPFGLGLESFRNEARLLKRFYHKHIVHILDYFEQNNTAYLVMDYYEGESLQSYLSRQTQQRLPWREALTLLMPLLDGLQHVHEERVLHRDIKPSNLYLTKQGQLILLDFGSARQVVAGHSRSLTSILTPGYAPVEQYGVESQGPWTDVYAVAATLYRVITGRTPPPASDRVLQDTLLAPSAQVPEIPSELNLILLQALAVRPQQRLRSVEQLKLQLQEVLRQPSSSEKTGSSQQPSSSDEVQRNSLRQTVKWLVIAILAVGLSVGATLGSLVWRNPQKIFQESQDNLSSDDEVRMWQEAERCGSVSCYQSYLDRYPQGSYAQYAAMRMAQLQIAGGIDKPLQAFQIFQDRLRDGSLGPKMVFIPKGKFVMGSPDKEVGRSRDNVEQQHLVNIEQSFSIGQYEVTVGEFKKFVNATRYRTDAERNAGGVIGCNVTYLEHGRMNYSYQERTSWRNPGFPQEDQHPVVCVSWGDAMAYAEWLSKQTGKTYRLPTEAEWEYVTRAKTISARYWGNQPDQACQYANVADLTLRQALPSGDIHGCTDKTIYTAAVGSFQPNPWKIYDLLGNVWEWTCSVYDRDYRGLEKQCAHSADWDSPRVIRGGSWLDGPAAVRSANRIDSSPLQRTGGRGFRLVRES